MDAAIDALTSMGFSKDLITRKVEDLLEIYDGEWVFIEESSYKVLIDLMLEEQEEPSKKKNDGDSASDSDEPSEDDYCTEPTRAPQDAEPTRAHQDAEPTRGHQDAEPSNARSEEHVNKRDAAIITQAGTRQQWKDISCIPPGCTQVDGQDNRFRRLRENDGQGEAVLHSPPKRRPCYGWIGGSDDEDECVYFITEASQRKEMRRGITPQKDRKSRFDVR